MTPVTLQQLSLWAEGALIQGVPATLVGGVSTNSRTVEAGQLFVALKGDRFDAHHFLQDVVTAEAAAVLVSELPASLSSYSGGIIKVSDPLTALQRIARHYRLGAAAQVVGVTGSNGKTSTKDFLKAVLGGGGNVHATPGNLNNHIGVPLTVLSGALEDAYWVVEMGMNHPGEIEVLAEIASPDVAVITTVGTAHIEHMGTRQAIAEEKATLFEALSPEGFGVMPVADDYYEFVRQRHTVDLIGVGVDEGTVQASRLAPNEHGGVSFDLQSEFHSAVRVTLKVPGRHMVANALLAAAVGLRSGIAAPAVAEALSNARLTSGRVEERRVQGIRFLDDSYNANPDSMRAALGILRDATVAGRRIAVLGFMGELGDHEEAEHLRLGAQVVEQGVDVLLTVGERAAVINRGASALEENLNLATHEEVAAWLAERATAEDYILIKGSRAARMEQIISHFSDLVNETATTCNSDR